MTPPASISWSNMNCAAWSWCSNSWTVRHCGGHDQSARKRQADFNDQPDSRHTRPVLRFYTDKKRQAIPNQMQESLVGVRRGRERTTTRLPSHIAPTVGHSRPAALPRRRAEGSPAP